MKLRLATAGVIMALLAMFIAAPMSASAAPKAPAGTATLVDALGTTIGTVTNLQAVFDVVTGLTTITGTLTTTAGQIINFSQTLVGATGTCEILNLDLGPLSLDLLGLQVDLSRVVLNITAQAGAGNLLGNLLCAVAGLLDGSGPLQGLTGLLNNLFRLLG
jgi:hypothetical protein